VNIDFKSPDYTPIFRARAGALEKLRAHPDRLLPLKRYYTDNPIQFIEDWGITVDPRNASSNIPILMPFILFPKQREWLEFTLQNWKDGEFGLTEKSRDVGISWLAVALSCTLCLYYKNMVIGFGSQQQDKVDLLGDPSCLFYKARQFMDNLPREFIGSWDIKKNTPHMRLFFPDTNSAIVGECGDNIGRGGRTAIYFIDEAAHLEHPQLVDQSLSATTNCRFDMSSVFGTANPFAEKANSGKYRKFTFHWRDDPRKDDAWYEKLQERYDPVTIAQEYDINYSASVEGMVIPSEWVSAAVDAHIKLGMKPSGKRRGALDVADEGKDKNAFVVRYGNVLTHAESWSGKGSDIFATAEKAFFLADQFELEEFSYDNDGLGAGITGDARIIADRRKAKKQRHVTAVSFRGSGKVLFPERMMVPGRKNEDFFKNAKSQGAWHLRFMFQETWRAIRSLKDPSIKYDPDMVISIASGFKELPRLLMELSQPTYSLDVQGKVVIDKSPEGTLSPNLYDGTMMAFAPRKPELRINPAVLDRVSRVA
jgi:hypothetical protein